MAGIKVSVDVRGMKQMMTIVERLTRKMKGRTDLHARWAILAYNWVMRNFQSEGGLVGGWKKLSPNTLAARRGGTGRILQDTGVLKGSFIPRWNDQQASVGSPLAIALYHEKGTRPYDIVPKKPGGFLRFKVATQTGVRTRALKSGRTISLPFAKGEYVYAKLVHHPGLAIRRMLPRQDDPLLIRDLLRTGSDYLRQQSEGG